MKSKFTRLGSILMCIVMLVGILPVQVHADWEDGMECWYCCHYHWDEYCCGLCGACSEECTNGGCYLSTHCSECGACDQLADDCSIHTSAASVAVLPEADEFDVELNMNDIRKDTFCSSGPGGQSVNTTYSAIRLTHIPSGIVVQCQDEKSQLKNFDKALQELRTRLYNMEYEKYLAEISAKRKTMVAGGDRSAKIRTYNYPQSRVTDHRINYTMYNLPVFMDGAIQEVIDQLQIAENAERLKAAE